MDKQPLLSKNPKEKQKRINSAVTRSYLGKNKFSMIADRQDIHKNLSNSMHVRRELLLSK